MTEYEAAEYIREHAQALMRLASQAKMPLMAFLLELVICEADDILRLEDKEPRGSPGPAKPSPPNRRRKKTAPAPR